MLARTAALVLMLAGVAWGQAAAPAPAPAPEKKPAPAGEPTLDDLLGTSPAKGGDPKSPEKPRPPAVDPARAELERRLTDDEARDHFEQAVALMGETATRLTGPRDPGIATQRLQEDAIRRLDLVIKQAEQNRQRRQQRQKQQQQQQQQQQNQQQQEQASRQNERRNNDSREEADPPGRQREDLRAELAARGQAWGALPARVRDALLQGSGDSFSTLYRQWTERYYRKLAEEDKK